ncbi:MAG: enolase C-terminal domain-like protein [Gemmatimonadota bacterium]|nr:enolase C-terminal domain-like protein [Gemmatimonadota bacterium]
MKIIHAEVIALNIPFYAEHVTRAMNRANTHTERVWVYRLETDNGLVSWTDGHGHDNVDDLIGKNPYAIMRDDSIGFGPQVAVLDLIGQDAGVPIHALLGSKLREKCPISWWDIDMSAGDWVKEAQESVKRGYTCFKMKARPWRDIINQTNKVSGVVPGDYKFDIDFNGFLLTAAKAEMFLQQLDENPNVGMYESPFYLRYDLEGAKILRARVRKPIVEHFQESVLHAHASDGFVVGGGVTATMRQAVLAAEFNKPFWLQLVGAGPTTAFAAHLGSVLSHAQLPYITCHELWEHDLLMKRINVENGYMQVSDKPGLGVEVDVKAVEKYRVARDEPTPAQRYRAKKRILRVISPGGGKKKRVWEFTDETIYQPEFYKGNLPGFERGVDLEVIEEDKSSAFKKAHKKLRESEATVAREPKGI